MRGKVSLQPTYILSFLKIAISGFDPLGSLILVINLLLIDEYIYISLYCRGNTI